MSEENPLIPTIMSIPFALIGAIAIGLQTSSALTGVVCFIALIVSAYAFARLLVRFS